MKETTTILACLCAAAGQALAQPHESDIVLAVQSGRVITGAVPEGSLTPVFPRRVFGATLGDTGIAGATFNPGYDSENGTFSPAQQVGITVDTPLRVWNGQSLVVSSDVRMNIIKNSVTITTPDPGTGSGGGNLVMGLASSTGRIHQHPAYQAVTDLPALPTAPLVLEVRVWAGGPASGSASEPAWIIFDAGDAAAAAAARAWAEANLAPPACYANCDQSTVAPVLNVGDFSCFLTRFASAEPYANCDQSTVPPLLNVGDFSCFLQQFAGGCP